MIKKLLFTMLAATMMMGSAQAQPQQRPSKEEMVKMRTERMAERYGLNEAQKAKLFELNTEYADVMRPMGPPRGQMQRPEGAPNAEGPRTAPDRQQPQAGQGNRPPRHEGGPNPEFMEKMAEYDKKLEQILTPEQMAKYNEDKANRRQGFGRGRGPQKTTEK